MLFGRSYKKQAVEIFERIIVMLDDLETNWNMIAKNEEVFTEYTKADFVGLCVYYVASLRSPKVGMEITHLYENSISKNYCTEALLARVNSTYQKIRQTTEAIQLNANSMSDIFSKQAAEFAGITGIKLQDGNREMLIVILSNLFMYLHK